MQWQLIFDFVYFSAGLFDEICEPKEKLNILIMYFVDFVRRPVLKI
jgi:hypothetical protein